MRPLFLMVLAAVLAGCGWSRYEASFSQFTTHPDGRKVLRECNFEVTSTRDVEVGTGNIRSCDEDGMDLTLELGGVSASEPIEAGGKATGEILKRGAEGVGKAIKGF